MLTRFHSYATLADSLIRIADQGTVKTISFDVFDTLVHRRLAAALVLEGVCHILRDLLAEQGIAEPEESLLKFRHEAYMNLVSAHVAAGLDPDTTLDELAPAWVALASGSCLDEKQTRELGRKLASAEFNIESSVCYANPWLKVVLPELKRRNIKVVCISDMYLGQQNVKAILENCGLLPSIDSVHVSGDIRLLKRTGRLFKHLEVTEALDIETWIHVGDNLHADGLMANQRGIRAWIVNDRLIHSETRRQEFDAGVFRNEACWAGIVAAGFAQNSVESSLSEEELFGLRVLGPIFTSFIHRLLERCKEEKIEQVFFFAREGHLLKNLYLKLAHLVFPDGDHPAAVYLAVSRLTALMAAMNSYGMRELNAAMANTGHYSLRSLLAPLQLDESFLRALAARYDQPDIDVALPAPILEQPSLLQILDDPALKKHIGAIGNSARQLLHAYLAQVGFFQHDRIAVVDLGWGGQIQDSLNSSLRSMPARPIIFGFYLGTNDRAAQRDCTESRLEGLLTDSRYPHWSSSAALEFVFAFEAASRAPHGTTLGYKPGAKGEITPVFKDARDPSRLAEIADEGFVALLQSGIDAYAKCYVQCGGILRFRAAATIPYARTMIERMVRYPTRQEILWWMHVSNVADLGSSSTDQLGGTTARPSLLTLPFRLKTSMFHYGLIGLAAGRPGQIAVAVKKGLRRWKNYQPPPLAGRALPASVCVPRHSTLDPPLWENEIDDNSSINRATATRTPLTNTRHWTTTLTLTELISIVIGYTLAKILAAPLGVALPKQDAPRITTMTRRYLHGKYNLQARFNLLLALARELSRKVRK
ncbi:MAG: hypothetical protein K9J74_03875 [Sulfuritalea sp.]|nr:hypothetical protein [Sulfuritalea sp.]